MLLSVHSTFQSTYDLLAAFCSNGSYILLVLHLIFHGTYDLFYSFPPKRSCVLSVMRPDFYNSHDLFSTFCPNGSCVLSVMHSNSHNSHDPFSAFCPEGSCVLSVMHSNSKKKLDARNHVEDNSLKCEKYALWKENPCCEAYIIMKSLLCKKKNMPQGKQILNVRHTLRRNHGSALSKICLRESKSLM